MIGIRARYAPWPPCWNAAAIATTQLVVVLDIDLNSRNAGGNGIAISSPLKVPHGVVIDCRRELASNHVRAGIALSWTVEAGSIKHFLGLMPFLCPCMGLATKAERIPIVAIDVEFLFHPYNAVAGTATFPATPARHVNGTFLQARCP